MSGSISQLRRLRFELGELSIRDFAKRLGVDYAMFHRVESGITAPTVRILEALKKTFGITLDEANQLANGVLPVEAFQRIVQTGGDGSGKMQNDSGVAVAQGAVGGDGGKTLQVRGQSDQQAATRASA